jgi:hypothetical protein
MRVSMAVVLRGGAIFLHVPKTGGNWVTAVLRRNDLVDGYIGHKHANVDRLLAPVATRSGRVLGRLDLGRSHRRLKPKPFIFCFVRHPLRWYESWFNYMSHPSRRWCDWGNERDLFDWHPNAVLNGCGSPDFNTFVRNVVKKRPGYVTELFNSYAQPQIDFVGKQENLRLDLITVLETLALDFDQDLLLTHEEVGVSPPPVGQPLEWDSRLREEVLGLENVAMLRHGYSPSDVP